LLPILQRLHPIHMNSFQRIGRRRLPGGLFFLVVLVLAGVVASAHGQSQPLNVVEPLPQEMGAAGLREELLRLQTTARLMHTTAHPDDEDGGLLTLESRGKGVSALLMTLTRGEGGQNKLGSNLFDVLGVLRALELTASDRYYGVAQRFSRVADFGYSKKAEETFQKWHGHEIALGDMVRVIRTFRPDVLIARFSGTERDGHGHHQASSLLTREAFRAAADPNRFPEQIKEGLLPWQVKKLYIGLVCGFGATTCPAENYTVKLNTGVWSPDLNASYVQFAMQGLKHQLSQGAGNWTVEAGDRFVFYKLVDSVVTSPKDKDGHEQNFFDGIDTSLPGLAGQLGEEEKKADWLRPALSEIAMEIQRADAASKQDPQGAAGSLFPAVAQLRVLLNRVENGDLSAPAKLDLLTALREKQEQAERALALSLGVTLSAEVRAENSDAKLPPEKEALTAVSPGQEFSLAVKFHNGSKYPLTLDKVALEGMWEWTQEKARLVKTVAPGADYTTTFAMKVPEGISYTRPYWHRDDPETDTLNTIDNPRYLTLPFPPDPFHARVEYALAGKKTIAQAMEGKGSVAKSSTSLAGNISAPVEVPFLNERGIEEKRRLATAPAFSVMLDPGEQVIPVDGGAARTVKVSVQTNVSGASAGTLRLESPSGWRVEPETVPVKLEHRGAKQDFEFKVFPSTLMEERRQIRAVLTQGKSKFNEGYSLVTREDLGSAYYYQPALQRVSIVNVKLPEGLKVGYIMGAGDEIPTVLSQVGMDVIMIEPAKLASEDLSRFGTIVVGIRAYDTQKEVIANNKKLLDFVSNGGTLLVQYNASASDFNSGHYTPYRTLLSRDRVSVEDAPVQILEPANPVFRYPNQITQKDFEGWIQERGLYFMDSWDNQYTALLESHDPGENEQKGGLLEAKYGKGIYIYTGYAFFRQLPAGVPGAIRLYVNLLSAGHGN